MPEFEKAGYIGDWLPGRRISGEYGIAFIVKRRFDVDMASAKCEPAEEQPPVTLSCEFFDDAEPEEADVLYPSELAIEKRRVDVIVRGTAYAPGGVPTEEFTCGFKISGVLERELRIIGNRVARWTPPEKWLTEKEKEQGERQEYPLPTFTDPRPIEKLEVRYKYAYGGKGVMPLDPEFQEIAAEHQETAKVVEKRNERKKELVEEMLKEEEEKEKKAKEAAEKAAAGPMDIDDIEDDETRQKAEVAFYGDEPGTERAYHLVGGEQIQESGTQMLDADMVARLDAADAAKEPEMVKVSEYKLGKDMPDRPEEAEPEEEPPDQDKDKDEDSADDDEEKEEGSELDEFFSSPQEGKTSMIDISELESRDELKEHLDEQARERARRLADKHGTKRDRATEFGDIQLSDEEWVAKYGAKPRVEKKIVKVESEFPEIPFPGNPSGRGFCVSELEAGVDGIKLPNIEWPDAPLRPEYFRVALEDLDLWDLEYAAGFGPYPMAWYPRAMYCGVNFWDVDAAEDGIRKQLEELDPEDPEDEQAIENLKNMALPMMQPEFFQDAQPRMQVDRIGGDEEVLLHNMSPDGQIFLKLPGTHPFTQLNTGMGYEPLDMRLDTLTIDATDPDKPFVELIWRGWKKLKDFDEMDEFTKFEIDIDQVDQVQWYDLQREADKERARAYREDADRLEDGAMQYEEADDEYRKHLGQYRKGGGEGTESAETGVKLWDQSQGRKVVTDEWDEQYREEKEEWVEDALKRQEELKKERLRKIRKKAREKADEEFGIERVDAEELEAEAEEKVTGKKKKK